MNKDLMFMFTQGADMFSNTGDESSVARTTDCQKPMPSRLLGKGKTYSTSKGYQIQNKIKKIRGYEP